MGGSAAAAAVAIPLQPLLGGKESAAEASVITYKGNKRVESSYKFRCEDIVELSRRTGFECEIQWVDEEWPFAQSLLRAV